MKPVLPEERADLLARAEHAIATTRPGHDHHNIIRDLHAYIVTLTTPNYMMDEDDPENSGDLDMMAEICDCMDAGDIKTVDYYKNVYCYSRYAVVQPNGQEPIVFDTMPEAAAAALNITSNISPKTEVQ